MDIWKELINATNISFQCVEGRLFVGQQVSIKLFAQVYFAFRFHSTTIYLCASNLPNFQSEQTVFIPELPNIIGWLPK